MTRARDLARFANANAISVDTNLNVGIGSTTPDAKLDIVGIVSATSFSGDGSGLTGISSVSFATTSFGLSGSPNITVGVITATTLKVGTGVTINAGIISASDFIDDGTNLLTAINTKASTGKAIAMAMVFG